jgi:hypothetical protein
LFARWTREPSNVGVVRRFPRRLPGNARVHSPRESSFEDFFRVESNAIARSGASCGGHGDRLQISNFRQVSHLFTPKYVRFRARGTDRVAAGPSSSSVDRMQ